MFHKLVRTDKVALPGPWVYFCSAVLSYSAIVCNIHLREYIIVVKD